MAATELAQTAMAVPVKAEDGDGELGGRMLCERGWAFWKRREGNIP